MNDYARASVKNSVVAVSCDGELLLVVLLLLVLLLLLLLPLLKAGTGPTSIVAPGAIWVHLQPYQTSRGCASCRVRQALQTLASDRRQSAGGQPKRPAGEKPIGV
uniref:Uncharacterized protein n=1 Tax=Anopheles maculatus TaxID=74869 RepID=A0A182SGY4_9DIPT